MSITNNEITQNQNRSQKNSQSCVPLRTAKGKHGQCTVQTVDLILPRIGRIPQLHSCIEKKFMPERLCCVVRNFTLAPQVTHDPGIIFRP